MPLLADLGLYSGYEVDGEQETVRAGEMAVMTEDGEITVTEFTARESPRGVSVNHPNALHQAEPSEKHNRVQ